MEALLPKGLGVRQTSKKSLLQIQLFECICLTRLKMHNPHHFSRLIGTMLVEKNMIENSDWKYSDRKEYDVSHPHTNFNAYHC